VKRDFRKLCSLLFLAFLVCGALARAQEKPLATVDGVPVLESELNLRGQLHQLEQQAYQLRLRAVEETIARRLLEKAAASKKLAVEELLKQEVDNKVPDPSPQEVEAYYLGQRDRLRQPLEAVREQLQRALKSLKVQEARQRYQLSLRRTVSVVMLLRPPRLSVEIGDAPRKGPVTAPVTIVEFSDYQCPYCKQAQSTLREVMGRYGDRVSLVYKDFPLPIHPEAHRAAQAARCAGDEGKFWEYQDALFAASSFDSGALSDIARRVGVDGARLQDCVASARHTAAVDADVKQGQTLGITATPSFLINGIFLPGAQPLDVFAKIIDSELRLAASERPGSAAPPR